jgi:predicted lipoprotein with Yx(FWY)xxD motif
MPRSFSRAATALASLLWCLSCTKDPLASAMSSPQPRVIIKNSPVFSNYLADSLGSTLYFFANDFDGSPACTAGCADTWPPYYAGAVLTNDMLAAGLAPGDFGIVTTPGGSHQTTYKGWPMYYYAPLLNGTHVRERAGDTGGDAIGNLWFIARSDYSIMMINAQLTGKNGKNYKSDYSEGTGKTQYFSDSRGMALYAFSPDSFNTNKYTKPDLSNNGTWPVYESETAVVPSVLDKSLFGTISVYGKKQLTYKGWPMYYSGQDSMKRGFNRGVSVPTPGFWPVVVKTAPFAPR